MSTNNFWKSDLNDIFNVVQNSMIVYPKEIIIATLRDYFSKDSYYHFSKNQWGFANTTDHTDLPLGADLPSGPGANPNLNPFPNLSTRLFIGENYRYDGIYYPAILVKNGGTKSVPISMNRNKGTINYSETLYEDGYGNQQLIRTPSSFVTAGAWEGSVLIDIKTRSLRARDDLLEAVSMCFTEINFQSLYEVGLIVKPLSIGSPTESDDRNDKLFSQTITLDIRTEWRREIPIKSVIDSILFTVQFVDFNNPNAVPDPNLTINTEVSLIDNILAM